MMNRALLISLAWLVAACSEPAAPPAGPAATRDPLLARPEEPLAQQIVVEPVAMKELRDFQRVPARVEADETRMARVGAPVAGRVVDLAAREGDRVRRGQVLAVLNSTELSGAQLAYVKSISQRGLAARAAARAQQLYDADVLAASELQRRQAELAQAEAELNAARGQLKVLGMSDAALERLGTTGTIHSTTQIVSPLAGTIIDRKVTEGQVVQPADGVFLVADLSTVWVVADVPEQAAASVRIGGEVVIELASFPGRPLPAAVTYVAPTVSPETRTVRVRVDVPNAERTLKPNMLASMVIASEPQRRLTVPSESVVREDNRDWVFLRTGRDEYRLAPVMLGTDADGWRAVLSGLREGDPIVVKGAFHLNNDRKK